MNACVPFECNACEGQRAIRLLGTGATDSYELCEYWEPNLGPLQEQLLLTAEPPLEPFFLSVLNTGSLAKQHWTLWQRLQRLHSHLWVCRKTRFTRQSCLANPRLLPAHGPLPVWPAMTMGCTESWKSLSSTKWRKSTRGSRREEFRQMMLSFSSCSSVLSVIFWSSTRIGKVTWLSREWQRVKNFSRWLSWEGRRQKPLMRFYPFNIHSGIWWKEPLS